jgi:hypothetical protein
VNKARLAQMLRGFAEDLREGRSGPSHRLLVEMAISHDELVALSMEAADALDTAAEMGGGMRIVRRSVEGTTYSGPKLHE